MPGFEAVSAPLPGPRRAFASAVHQGHAYFVGGMRDGFELVDDCLRFTFEAQTYEPIACPERPRVGASLIALRGSLYLVGGSVRAEQGSPSGAPPGLVSARSIEVYDPSEKAWSVLIDDVPFDPRQAHIQRFRERLLLLSTHREAARVEVMLVSPR